MPPELVERGQAQAGEIRERGNHDSCQRRMLRLHRVRVLLQDLETRADVKHLVEGVVEDTVGGNDSHDKDGQQRRQNRIAKLWEGHSGKGSSLYSKRLGAGPPGSVSGFPYRRPSMFVAGVGIGPCKIDIGFEQGQLLSAEGLLRRLWSRISLKRVQT